MSAGPAPRFVIGVVAGGGILLVATFVALYRVAALDLPDALLLTGLLVGLPTLTLAQLPMMAEAVLDRVSAYWGSIGTLAGLGLLGWLVGARSGGPAAIGFTPIGIGALAAWTFALTIAGLGTIVVFRQIGLVLSVQESPILRALLPRSTASAACSVFCRSRQASARKWPIAATRFRSWLRSSGQQARSRSRRPSLAFCIPTRGRWASDGRRRWVRFSLGAFSLLGA